ELLTTPIVACLPCRIFLPARFAARARQPRHSSTAVSQKCLRPLRFCRRRQHYIYECDRHHAYAAEQERQRQPILQQQGPNHSPAESHLGALEVLKVKCFSQSQEAI